MHSASEAVVRRRAAVQVVLLSTVYPNVALPSHGIFVRERMHGLPGGFAVRVVAPTPWFPGTTGLRPGLRPRLPRREVQQGTSVDHPRFPSVPAVLKCLDGVALAAAAVPVLRRLWREQPFHVLDAHFAYPEGLAAVLLGRLFRVPVVLTLRGTLPFLVRHRLRRAQAAWAIRQADRVIAVSESLRREAAALGRPAHRIRVIPNGVDPDLFQPLDRAASRASIGVTAALADASAPLLLAVGTLSRRKGFDLAIGALRLLEPAVPDARLVVVGGAGAEGAEEVELRALAQRLGVAERVTFAGPQPRERLATFYSAADLLLLPSAVEGCPNVVLEAIACGTPVVATPVGGVPEILAAAEAGLVATPRTAAGIAAAAAQALGQPWDRERLRAWSLRRSWATVGAEVAEELRAALVESHHSKRRAPRLRLAPPPPTAPPSSSGAADVRSAAAGGQEAR